MEIHPLLYELDKKDSERYMNACKDDLMDFLDNLCLSNTLALQVLEEVRISLES
jgi:DNA polymerase III alpha subunit (gram-positive type)